MRLLFKIICFALCFVVLTSCDSESMQYKNKPDDEFAQGVNEWNEVYHRNLKPRYGNSEPTDKQRMVDKEFIDGMLKDYKDKTIAAKRLANRGWYYFFHNKIDTAMFRFNQSWLIDSTYAESYFGFAAIKEYQGLKSESDKFYQTAYKHDNSDTLSKKILNKIADIKEQQKDTTSMLNAFHRAFNKFPNNDIASGKLGYFYSILNKPDSALKYFSITIELDPNYEQTYINRAFLYCELGNYEEAIFDCSTVIKKNNKSIYGFGNRANAYMLNKQYKLAIEDLNRCIELNQKHPNFHLAKAECYHLLKDENKACEEIRNGIKKGGKYNDRLKEYKCEH